MTDLHCAFCGAIISRAKAAKRGHPASRAYCNREHRVADDVARGHYKEMSEAGSEARSVAVAASNKIKPRRKKCN